MHIALWALRFIYEWPFRQLDLKEMRMSHTRTFQKMKAALNGSPRNSYTAEMHLQAIKYAEELQGLTGKEFCEGLGIGESFGAEFTKMRKIAERLRKAGLDPERI
jgi:hypothetical protein